MMCMVVASLFLLIGTLFADQTTDKAEIDRLMGEMEKATGEDYTKLRNRLLGLLKDISYLEKVAKEENWTKENWRKAFYASVLLAWRKRGEVCRKCYDLKGLNPEFYLKKRRPEPEVVRELVALGKDAVPIMLEIMLKTLPTYEFTERLPEGYSGDVDELRNAEKRALKVGIVAALGMLKDERVHHFLVELLGSEDDADVRAAAAKSIGRIGAEGAVSVLSERLSDEGESKKVRCGAALGLGFTGKSEALDALIKQLEKKESESSREIAKALGFLVSRWQNKEDTDEMERMRKRAIDALLSLLQGKRSKATVREALYSLARIGDEETVKRMEALLKETDGQELRKEILIGIDALKSRLRREKD